MVKKLPAFMDPEGSLSYSHTTARHWTLFWASSHYTIHPDPLWHFVSCPTPHREDYPL